MIGNRLATWSISIWYPRRIRSQLPLGFVLLRDGERFVVWLGAIVPVSEDVQQELMAELDDLMWASVVDNAAVAGIQAVLLGVGLVLVGMPGAVFLTVATFVPACSHW